MADRSLIFPSAEFESRVTRLQTEMAAREHAAIMLTSPADIFYITGFLTRFWESPARPWFVVVPAVGEPVAVIPVIGAPLMARTWMRDIRTWDAPNPQDDGVSLLSETLADLVPNVGDIAVPMGLETHLRMPLGDFERLKAQIAPRRIVDGTAAIQRVREVKSEAEISKIKYICEIAARTFDRVPEFAVEGAPLDDVFRAFQMTLLHEGADWVSYVAGGAGASGYEDVISPAPSTPLHAGDVLMLDTGAVKDGYFCDYDRNFAIGPASEPAKATYRALWNATEQVLADMRPGLRACDVHQMFVTLLRREGVAPGGGRLGHGLGVTLTEWPSFTALDETPLREGMVLTLEPGAIVEGEKIMVHEENIVLRESGPELLSPRAPEHLPEIM